MLLHAHTHTLKLKCRGDWGLVWGTLPTLLIKGVKFATVANRMISTEEKTKVITTLQKNGKDTGSTEVQVGILTARIKELTEHLKIHKKDNHSRRGLLQMVGKRKRFLGYLKENDYKSYEKLVKKLNLRG